LHAADVSSSRIALSIAAGRVTTKRVRELVSVPGATFQGVAIAPDDRTMFFTFSMSDGDIWMATLGTPSR
jgi:hypothetical protein